MFVKLLSVLLLSTVSLTSLGSPVLNTSNGHYYELHSFKDDWRLDWSEAKAFAESLTFQGNTGYLATVTSQEEDDFLWNVLGAQGSFLGGFDKSTLDSNTGLFQHQNWQWVTGEPFNFSNWLPGEPNHWQDGSDLTPNEEDYLMYWWQTDANGGRWNDTNLDSSYLTNEGIKYVVSGFVVEFNPASGENPVVPLPPSAWMFISGMLLMFHRNKDRFTKAIRL